MAETQAFTELRLRIREMLELMRQGSTFPKLSRAQGVVDGYMKALLETGQASQRELLALVNEVRAEMDGPATAELDLRVA
jgi:hypothetical protein